MDIKLPKLGEDADSGTVVNVLVSAGDTIEKDQTIIELENEKAVVPVPASAGGKVSEVKVKSGDKLSVGQVILVIEGGAGTAAKPEQKAEKVSSVKEATSAKPTRRVVEVDESDDEFEEEEIDESTPMPPASPTVRFVAHAIGIDLRRIQATGAGGRVEISDVRAHVQRLVKLASRKSSSGGGSEAPAPVSAPVDFAKWGPVRREPMSELRNVIARRMVENKNTLPHVTQFADVDVTDLEALRKKHAADWKAAGAPLTLTVFAIKAVLAALQKHPLFNASIDDTAAEVVLKDYFNIGIAVDTDAGLMVPVIRDVDKKSFKQIAEELTSIAVKARDRKLSGDDMKGGTFTISNQGAIGGSHFTPIINKPESAILGIGRGSQQARVIDGQIVPRLIMPITISYDHRLIDGGEAARFTVDLVEAFGRFQEVDLGN